TCGPCAETCGPCADRLDERGVCGPWPVLEAQPANAYLFSPARSREERFEDMRAKRKTRVQPSQLRRAKAKPRKKPGDRYPARSYTQAIANACAAGGLAHWHPNQLRHSHGTEVRRRFGLEAAQVVLGHASADVTQVYAERDLALALRVAAEMG